MPETQKNPLGNTLSVSIVQQNLKDLFQFAHRHTVKSAFPTTLEGAAQDIVTVDDGEDVYLVVKTSRGWFRTDALTAL